MFAIRAFTVAAALLRLASAFPNAPFNTDGRWIKDSTGAMFTYMGVNWPGAGETMLPEGLQYQSVETLVGHVKSAGLNSIRLTFAIEMIDQIFENGGNDIPISTAFTNALGQANGTQIYNQVLENNPSFNGSTRLQVFDAIAAECNKQGIYVHLDNHISTAEFCCGYQDGNGWFGDTDFDVGNWTRGLAYMAQRGLSWPSLVSFGLRNELRPPLDNVLFAVEHYNWGDWYTHMRMGADAVNGANSGLLIFMGGINSDTTLLPIPIAAPIGFGVSFDLSSFAYKNKLVLELHNYDTTYTPTLNCPTLKATLYLNGFDAMDTSNPLIKNVMPVVLSEFGYGQDETSVSSTYATCLRSYLPSEKAGWMVWVLAGSYYIRSGVQDSDESYGLLNHNFSDLRNAAVYQQGIGALIAGSSAS